MQALQRLLFVFSKLNSGLKYVQGMNELVAPLYMVFVTDSPTPEAAEGAEADAFFCFIRVLTVSETRDLYCKTLDTATTGVASVMAECAYHSQNPAFGISISRCIDTTTCAHQCAALRRCDEVTNPHTMNQCMSSIVPLAHVAGCGGSAYRRCMAGMMWAVVHQAVLPRYHGVRSMYRTSERHKENSV